MYGPVESGACHWTGLGNACLCWVAYRELLYPRLIRSAGSGKRRRREGPSGPTNWLVLILGRLENLLHLFQFRWSPTTLANIPPKPETERHRQTTDTR